MSRRRRKIPTCCPPCCGRSGLDSEECVPGTLPNLEGVWEGLVQGEPLGPMAAPDVTIEIVGSNTDGQPCGSVRFGEDTELPPPSDPDDYYPPSAAELFRYDDPFRVEHLAGRPIVGCGLHDPRRERRRPALELGGGFRRALSRLVCPADPGAVGARIAGLLQLHWGRVGCDKLDSGRRQLLPGRENRCLAAA